MKQKISKITISKFLKWTTSRYNPLKKSIVVDEVYEILKNGGIWRLNWKEHENLKNKKWREIESLGGKERVEIFEERRIYHAGSYCEGSIMSGTDYLVDGHLKCLLRGRLRTNRSFEEMERMQF